MPKEKILSILAGLHPEFDYGASSNFLEDGLLDSFDIVMLVAELEAGFGVRIPGDQIRTENFSDLVAIGRLVLGAK